VAQIKAKADPRRPAHVLADKLDIMRALLHSVDRALERRLISQPVLHRLLSSFLGNAVLVQDGSAEVARRNFAERHGHRAPPTVIVISPTKACNLHCVGCYASSGSEVEQLEWDVFDRLLSEAKELWGMRFFTISGGEPLVYRSHGKGLLDMVAKHHDCFFQVYTNGTLISEAVAQRLADLGNVVPTISVEGFRQRTDERRGDGVFDRILAAMANLRQAGAPFGISLTATRHNAEEILSDEFLDFFFEEQGAIFGWLFQYMPIGRSYTLDLLVTPEQRLWMWRRTWQIIRDHQRRLHRRRAQQRLSLHRLERQDNAMRLRALRCGQHPRHLPQGRHAGRHILPALSAGYTAMARPVWFRDRATPRYRQLAHPLLPA